MSRKPGERLPLSADELDGVTKAAILLLSLDPIIASEVLKELDPESLEEVARELAGRMGVAGPESAASGAE